MTIQTTALWDIWKAAETRERRRITVTEVSESTGLSPMSIKNLVEGKTTRFDKLVLVALCQYFDVAPGPVPFLVYDPEAK